ncbi:hypothetical protein MLD38_003406 [Melastoma candidum]|uniref:Uncharacterized protein n=1 Tax=Melastoma candidum TaxID=119954 RepID=A0ACB9S345_9MYRT|nr:hypothetical protein MLD38_003406 [Melastoma candidum]
MVLDALQKIKAEDDSTLSYRRSCREGICGSCSMNIDGTNTVACLKPIDPDMRRATMITPLPHMFVIKDLVVDLTNFYNQYRSIEPCLKTHNHPRMDGNTGRAPRIGRSWTGCMSAYFARFLGPGPLIHAYRWISDSRDEYADERLRVMTDDMRKLYKCRTIKNCTRTCPKSLDPAVAIYKMKARHLLSSPV